MALIVENGAGLIGADSFVSVEQADNFWDGRANLAWTSLTVTQKENALRDATDYVASKLTGPEPFRENQGQPWPWTGSAPTAFHIDRVRRATILAADVARLGPLLGGEARESRVLSRSKTLGPLSQSVTYSDREAATSANGRDLSFVDTLLAPLLSSGNGMVIGTARRG